MKTCSLLILFLMCWHISSGQSSRLDNLIQQKNAIDLFRFENQNSTEVFIKVAGQLELLKFDVEHIPENIETTFNIVKNDEGNVLLIGQQPYSQNGDRMMEFLHYFDGNENTFATYKQISFFNARCSDVVLIEIKEQFYGSGRVVLSEKYSLKDIDGKDMENQDCLNGNGHDFSIEIKASDLLKKINYSK